MQLACEVLIKKKERSHLSKWTKKIARTYLAIKKKKKNKCN